MMGAPSYHSEALRGRIAVVTGAFGGLGQAIVSQLHAMGADVVQVDLAEPAEAAQPRERLLTMHTDISSPDSVAVLAEAIRERFGRCDVLVNNAAVTTPAVPLECLSLETWDRVLGVNLRGTLVCTQALVRGMLDRGAGSIVNIASIAADTPSRSGAYGAAKAGLRALTRQMAVEWGPRGVRANSISPGMIRTPLSETHYCDEAKLHERISKIPSRRIGVPSDIADAVAFLASDAAAYVNGQDLIVDGGFSIAALHNLY